MNVGVLPSTLPPAVTATLWGTGDAFVKTIVTFPAFAFTLRVFVSNISWPLAFAARSTVPGGALATGRRRRRRARCRRRRGRSRSLRQADVLCERLSTAAACSPS